MPYGAPQKTGQPKYSGSVHAYATDEVNYGADISISFEMSVNGVAIAAPDIEGLCDPNFQSFLDHVASWSGFALPAGSEYTSITTTEVAGNKTYPVSEEATVTP
jgi:hypothetical protein